MFELAFTPDRTSAEPMYRQLRTYLQELVATDRLPAGTKLPATREVAGALGIARNTVAQAYDDLVADGLLTAHVGQGTFVAAVSQPAATIQQKRGFVWSGLFAQRARTLTLPQSMLPVPTSRIVWDFRGGQIATDSLPVNELAREFSRAVARDLPAIAAHRDPRGWPPLRRAVAAYLAARGIRCSARDVMIVDGAQQAIDLAARVLVDPGDTVAVEQPGYFGAWLAFSAAQAHLVGVGVDGDGLRTDELARVLRSRRVKLVYVTPAAHSPTGVAMSEPRRQALLALADEHQVPVFEDDYDSELRYEGAPMPALKARDAAGQVLYVGTFSKVLFPGLRVGYVVAAPPLLEKMALARWNADVETNVVAQAALARVLESGGLERHIRRMRRLYAARWGAMLGTIDATMPPGVRRSQPRGGHAVWLTLPPSVDPERLYLAALEDGIVYSRGETFHFDGRGRDSVYLSFANLTPARIAEGVGRFAEQLRRSDMTPRVSSPRAPSSRGRAPSRTARPRHTSKKGGRS